MSGRRGGARGTGGLATAVAAGCLAACAVCLGACGSSNASHRFAVHTAGDGCSVGSIHMAVEPSSAKPGSLVTVETSSGAGSDFAIEAVGSIGRLSGNSYDPLWSVAVDLSKQLPSVDTKLASPSELRQNGKNIGDSSFSFTVPAMAASSYQVRFVYEIPPDPRLAAGVKPGSYTICSGLRVS